MTLKAENIPLREAFAQMEAQSGQGFALGTPDDAKPVSLSVAAMPMWDALHALLEAAGQKQSFFFQTVSAGTRDQFFGRWSSNGPYLVLATNVVHDADFRRTEGNLEQLSVALQVMTDPSLGIAYMQGFSNASKAIDENGVSMVARPVILPQPSASYMTRAVRSVRVNLQLPVAGTSGLPHKIQVLEGTIAGGVVSQYQTIEVPVLESAQQEIDGATVSIKSTEQGTTFYTLEVKFAAPDTMTNEEWAAWSRRLPAARMRLLDADGKPISVTYSGGSSGQRNSVLRGQARKPATAAGAKFVIAVPTEVQEVEIPYHFEDLPLP